MSGSASVSTMEPEDWSTWKNEWCSCGIIPDEQRDSRSLFLKSDMGSLLLYNLGSAVSMGSCRRRFPAEPTRRREEKSSWKLYLKKHQVFIFLSKLDAFHVQPVHPLPCYIVFGVLEPGWCCLFEIDYVRVFQGHYSVWLVSTSHPQNNVPAAGGVDGSWESDYFNNLLLSIYRQYSLCSGRYDGHQNKCTIET